MGAEELMRIPWALCWLALPGLAQAATIVVDPTGGGDVTTMKEAGELAEAGDRVEIRAGTYVEEKVWFPESLTIVGDGRDVTILDGGSSARYGMYISADSDLSGVGFTGFTEAALSLVSEDEEWANSQVSIHDVALWNNGYGIQLVTWVWTDVQVVEATFADITSAGVSTYGFEGNLLVESCMFLDSTYGVALSSYPFILEGSRLTLVHNTFVGVEYGFSADGSYSMSAVELYAWNNLVGGSGKVGWGADSYVSGEAAGNVVGPDVSTASKNFSTSFDDSANTSGDPLFVDRSDDGDWTNDDLHLLLGSAAIDIGVDDVATLPTDLDGISRPVDGDADGTALPDAGAYEFVRLDEDGDGSLAASVGGEDCDDADPTILPGVDDPCGDGVDQDCDGADPPCGRDTGLADTGGGPGEEPGGDTASPQDSGSPTEDTGPVEGDSGRDSASGGGDAPGGEAAPPPCGCAGRQALVLWPLWLLVARRRRRSNPSEGPRDSFTCLAVGEAVVAELRN